MSRLDTVGGMPPQQSPLGLTLGILLWGALLAAYICPVTVLIAILRLGISRESAYALLAETILVFAQIFAFLPLVQ